MANNVNHNPDFTALNLALKPQDLQFQGGNVIIKLGDGPHDTLILHENVLASASERFAVRLRSSHWAPTREVKDSDTGEITCVFEYHLAQVEDTFCLTDEKEASAKDNRDGETEDGEDRKRNTRPIHLPRSSLVSFHQSCLVEEYVEKIVWLDDDARRTQSVYEHKILFGMLYPNNGFMDLDLGSPDQTLVTISDVAALAEYYMLLPTVANRISAHLEAMTDIWKTIAEDPEPYLALGAKLRSYNIFSEALSHLVGKSLHQSHHLSQPFNGRAPSEALDRLARRQQDELRDLADRLTRELREIGLEPYQAHPEAETKRKRGPLVRTTWLAASLREKKTLEEKCNWIASSIYREKLDQLMYGEPHWSHVQYVRNGRKDGDVEAGSLYAACRALVTAHNLPQTLDVFGHHAAAKFANIFDLHRNAQRNPAGLIAQELRRLVRKAVHAIQYWMPMAGAPVNDYARAQPARYQDVEYFAVLPRYFSCPWVEEYGGDGGAGEGLDEEENAQEEEEVSVREDNTPDSGW